MFNNLINAVGSQVPQFFLDFGMFKGKEKEHVYVVGNGWASYYFVKYLDKSKFKPIIIAPNSQVLNTPKLVNRVINPNEIVEFPNPYAEIITDMVEDINLPNKVLITKSGHQIPYNRVVLAIGSEPNDFGIPGVSEHTYKFKSIQDADLLRTKLNSLYTTSQIYIVGAGVTGIELATNISKMKIFDGFKGIGIKVIDGLDMILPGYNSNTKEHIYKELMSKYPNLEIKLNCLVNSINSEPNKSSELKYFDKNLGQTNSYWLNWNPRIESDIVVWTGGVRFSGYGKSKLFKTLYQISPIKPRGIEVNENFSLGKQYDTIFCLGDMVANQGPPSAQNAKNQGIWLAQYFNSGFDINYTKSNPYKITSKGKLVHLGDKIWLESEFYSGYIVKFIDRIIEWIK